MSEVKVNKILPHSGTNIGMETNISIGTPADPKSMTIEGSLIVNGSFNLVPIGIMFIWPLSTPPSGFIECDGSAVSRVTYANLFSVIGTTYGIGDGSTTFNVPNPINTDISPAIYVIKY